MSGLTILHLVLLLLNCMLVICQQNESGDTTATVESARSPRENYNATSTIFYDDATTEITSAASTFRTSLRPNITPTVNIGRVDGNKDLFDNNRQPDTLGLVTARVPDGISSGTDYDYPNAKDVKESNVLLTKNEHLLTVNWDRVSEENESFTTEFNLDYVDMSIGTNKGEVEAKERDLNSNFELQENTYVTTNNDTILNIEEHQTERNLSAQDFDTRATRLSVILSTENLQTSTQSVRNLGESLLDKAGDVNGSQLEEDIRISKGDLSQELKLEPTETLETFTQNTTPVPTIFFFEEAIQKFEQDVNSSKAESVIPETYTSTTSASLLSKNFPYSPFTLTPLGIVDSEEGNEEFSRKDHFTATPVSAKFNSEEEEENPNPVINPILTFKSKEETTYFSSHNPVTVTPVTAKINSEDAENVSIHEDLEFVKSETHVVTANEPTVPALTFNSEEENEESSNQNPVTVTPDAAENENPQESLEFTKSETYVLNSTESSIHTPTVTFSSREENSESSNHNSVTATPDSAVCNSEEAETDNPQESLDFTKLETYVLTESSVQNFTHNTTPTIAFSSGDEDSESSNQSPVTVTPVTAAFNSEELEMQDLELAKSDTFSSGEQSSESSNHSPATVTTVTAAFNSEEVEMEDLEWTKSQTLKAYVLTSNKSSVQDFAYDTARTITYNSGKESSRHNLLTATPFAEKSNSEEENNENSQEDLKFAKSESTLLEINLITTREASVQNFIHTITAEATTTVHSLEEVPDLHDDRSTQSASAYIYPTIFEKPAAPVDAAALFGKTFNASQNAKAHPEDDLNFSNTEPTIPETNSPSTIETSTRSLATILETDLPGFSETSTTNHLQILFATTQVDTFSSEDSTSTSSRFFTTEPTVHGAQSSNTAETPTNGLPPMPEIFSSDIVGTSATNLDQNLSAAMEVDTTFDSEGSSKFEDLTSVESIFANLNENFTEVSGIHSEDLNSIQDVAEIFTSVSDKYSTDLDSGFATTSTINFDSLVTDSKVESFNTFPFEENFSTSGADNSVENFRKNLTPINWRNNPNLLTEIGFLESDLEQKAPENFETADLPKAFELSEYSDEVTTKVILSTETQTTGFTNIEDSKAFDIPTVAESTNSPIDLETTRKTTEFTTTEKNYKEMAYNTPEDIEDIFKVNVATTQTISEESTYRIPKLLKNIDDTSAPIDTKSRGQQIVDRSKLELEDVGGESSKTFFTKTRTEATLSSEDSTEKYATVKTEAHIISQEELTQLSIVGQAKNVPEKEDEDRSFKDLGDTAKFRSNTERSRSPFSEDSQPQVTYPELTTKQAAEDLLNEFEYAEEDLVAAEEVVENLLNGSENAEVFVTDKYEASGDNFVSNHTNDDILEEILYEATTSPGNHFSEDFVENENETTRNQTTEKVEKRKEEFLSTTSKINENYFGEEIFEDPKITEQKYAEFYASQSSWEENVDEDEGFPAENSAVTQNFAVTEANLQTSEETVGTSEEYLKSDGPEEGALIQTSAIEANLRTTNETVVKSENYLGNVNLEESITTQTSSTEANFQTSEGSVLTTEDNLENVGPERSTEEEINQISVVANGQISFAEESMVNSSDDRIEELKGATISFTAKPDTPIEEVSVMGFGVNDITEDISEELAEDMGEDATTEELNVKCESEMKEDNATTATKIAIPIFAFITNYRNNILIRQNVVGTEETLTTTTESVFDFKRSKGSDTETTNIEGINDLSTGLYIEEITEAFGEMVEPAQGLLGSDQEAVEVAVLGDKSNYHNAPSNEIIASSRSTAKSSNFNEEITEDFRETEVTTEIYLEVATIEEAIHTYRSVTTEETPRVRLDSINVKSSNLNEKINGENFINESSNSEINTTARDLKPSVTESLIENSETNVQIENATAKKENSHTEDKKTSAKNHADNQQTVEGTTHVDELYLHSVNTEESSPRLATTNKGSLNLHEEISETFGEIEVSTQRYSDNDTQTRKVHIEEAAQLSSDIRTTESATLEEEIRVEILVNESSTNDTYTDRKESITDPVLKNLDTAVQFEDVTTGRRNRKTDDEQRSAKKLDFNPMKDQHAFETPENLGGATTSEDNKTTEKSVTGKGTSGDLNSETILNDAKIFIFTEKEEDNLKKYVPDTVEENSEVVEGTTAGKSSNLDEVTGKIFEQESSKNKFLNYSYVEMDESLVEMSDANTQTYSERTEGHLRVENNGPTDVSKTGLNEEGHLQSTDEKVTGASLDIKEGNSTDDIFRIEESFEDVNETVKPRQPTVKWHRDQDLVKESATDYVTESKKLTSESFVNEELPDEVNGKVETENFNSDEDENRNAATPKSSYVEDYPSGNYNNVFGDVADSVQNSSDNIKRIVPKVVGGLRIEEIFKTNRTNNFAPKNSDEFKELSKRIFKQYIDVTTTEENNVAEQNTDDNYIIYEESAEEEEVTTKKKKKSSQGKTSSQLSGISQEFSKGRTNDFSQKWSHTEENFIDSNNGIRLGSVRNATVFGKLWSGLTSGLKTSGLGSKDEGPNSLSPHQGNNLETTSSPVYMVPAATTRNVLATTQKILTTSAETAADDILADSLNGLEIFPILEEFQSHLGVVGDVPSDRFDGCPYVNVDFSAHESGIRCSIRGNISVRFKYDQIVMCVTEVDSQMGSCKSPHESQLLVSWPKTSPLSVSGRIVLKFSTANGYNFLGFVLGAIDGDKLTGVAHYLSHIMAKAGEPLGGNLSLVNERLKMDLLNADFILTFEEEAITESNPIVDKNSMIKVALISGGCFTLIVLLVLTGFVLFKKYRVTSSVYKMTVE